MLSRGARRLDPRTSGRPLRWLAALAIGGGAWGGPAAAQTLFQWPDTAVDVARYTTIEQCLAAVLRTQERVEQHEISVQWRDTLPPDPQRGLEPAPAPVTATAARCGARFTQATAELADYGELLRLFLLADRDTDAAALVTRRVAAAKTAGEREAVVDTAVTDYLGAQPVRLKAAEALLRARLRRLQDPTQRLLVYVQLMFQASDVDDTVLAHWAAQQLLTSYDALTLAEREELRTRFGPWESAVMLEVTYNYIGRQTVADSLRRSTAAYLELIQSIWTHVTGERPEAMELPIGEHAPKVAADFWFPADAAHAPHPTPGRVALVEFLGPVFRPSIDAAYLGAGDLPARFAALRRLAQRFPALEIILVGQTQGYAWYALMPTPANEAEWFHKAVEAERPPPGAVLAVSSTPFWRLPAPDGRRINEMVVNDTSYAFGRQPVESAAEFLVDQNGIVVSVGAGLGGRLPLDLMIDALLHQRAPVGRPAPLTTPGRDP